MRNLKNVLLRKSCLQFLGGFKEEKNSYHSTAYTNLAEILLWNVWSIYVLILLSSSKSDEQSANFEKCTLRKSSRFNFLEDIKKKKIRISALPSPIDWNLAVRHLKYNTLILQKSSKSVEYSVIFHLSIWWSQHFKNIPFYEFLTQFDSILRPSIVIAFLRAVTEINNKDTLKVCKKNMKITDPNLGLFLVRERICRWNSWQNLKLSIFIDRNCLLSIITDKKNYWFLPKCMKSRCGPLCRLRLLFLRREDTLFAMCWLIHYQNI